MKTLRAVSAAALLFAAWPGQAWAQLAAVRPAARVSALVLPVAPAFRLGAAPTFSLSAAPILTSPAPTLTVSPTAVPSAGRAQAAIAAAVAAARPAAAMTVAATVAVPQAAPAAPFRVAVSRDAGPKDAPAAQAALKGLAGRKTGSIGQSDLTLFFDGGRLAAPSAATLGRNAVAGRKDGLASASEGTSPKAAEPASPVPTPAPARRWGRVLAYGAVAAGLAAAAYAFAGPVMGFAESFGEGVNLPSELTLGSLGIAFGAGLLSFLSPCTLPLIPAYLSYASGVSLDDMKKGQGASMRRAVVGSLAFVAGFAVVFTALGATATAMGAMLLGWMPVIAKGAGLVVAVMGLHTMGVFHINLLYREKRMDMGGMKSRSKLLTSFLMGLAFAFGWTPCIGPILAGILGMAAMGETVTQGIALLAAYSMGLGVPFILAALGINRFLGFFQRFKKHFGVAERITGGLLVVVGILIFLGGLEKVAGFFS